MNEIIFWSGIYNNGMSRPVATYQLAFWLRQNNVKCQVIDFCQWHSKETLVSLTSKFISNSTKYIGISSGFWADGDIPINILESLNAIKKEYPDIKIIVGGQRADNRSIKDIADIIILGEAEDKLLSLIKGHNLSPRFDITKLNHRFSYEDCVIDGEILPIELGRGCIFKCKFCGHHNLGKSKHTYQRHVRLVEEEIIYNYENFKTTHYHFLDDTVNEDNEKIRNLSTIPKNTGIDLKWNGYLRADLLWRYPDTAELLYQSGMRGCFFGIESLNPYASRSIGKGWSGKHARQFLPYLYNDIWNQEINLWCNFIVGLPGETVDDLRNTADWCLENPIGYYRFVALNLYTTRTDTGSRSEFTNNYKNYGYKIDENGQWQNDFMTSAEADVLCLELNNKVKTVNRLSSWNLFDLKNCGIDIDNGRYISSLYQNIYREKFFIFLTEYKNKLLQL
jgi:hypothetical protein